MNAECRCSPHSGTCCRGHRAASELLVIALRVKETAPEFSDEIAKLGTALQKALTEDMVMKGHPVKVIG